MDKNVELSPHGFLILSKQQHPTLGNIYVQMVSKIYLGIGLMGGYPIRIFKEDDVEEIISQSTIIYQKSTKGKEK